MHLGKIAIVTFEEYNGKTEKVTGTHHFSSPEKAEHHLTNLGYSKSKLGGGMNWKKKDCLLSARVEIKNLID